ncbi:MAG: SufD family Fe-S cluster assembly protein [Bacteroidales bacterium]|nr:SufD family Fe-S cluster assembly protein [Bacteroidales bacterium]
MTGLYHKEEVIFQNSRSGKIEFNYDVPEDGELKLVFVSLGGEVYNRIRIKLGKRCDCTVYGLYIGNKEEKISFDIVVEHQDPESHSRQLFKGILGDTASADFSGLIKVDYDSQKTEAYQENHTLLLNDNARITTKPQLEIYADDVICSHGATVGRLDKDELFYLRSRGISLAEAIKMQQMAFLSDIIEQIKDETVIQAIENKLNKM